MTPTHKAAAIVPSIVPLPFQAVPTWNDLLERFDIKGKYVERFWNANPEKWGVIDQFCPKIVPNCPIVERFVFKGKIHAKSAKTPQNRSNLPFQRGTIWNDLLELFDFKGKNVERCPFAVPAWNDLERSPRKSRKTNEKTWNDRGTILERCIHYSVSLYPPLKGGIGTMMEGGTFRQFRCFQKPQTDEHQQKDDCQ